MNNLPLAFRVEAKSLRLVSVRSPLVLEVSALDSVYLVGIGGSAKWFLSTHRRHATRDLGRVW
eukprot:809786-Amorphochlora_amoeboformis.AAC.1